MSTYNVENTKEQIIYLFYCTPVYHRLFPEEQKGCNREHEEQVIYCIFIDQHIF